MTRPDQAVPVEERFWPKVERRGPDECWPFTGSRHKKSGYGQISVSRSKARGAHRVAYELSFGPIPEGRHVLHTCDNPPCCNPAHLYLGGDPENRRDSVSRGRHARGERHGAAKLTEQAVEAIRASSESQSALARRYGVSPSAISLVQRGVNWKPPTGGS